MEVLEQCQACGPGYSIMTPLLSVLNNLGNGAVLLLMLSLVIMIPRVLKKNNRNTTEGCR